MNPEPSHPQGEQEPQEVNDAGITSAVEDQAQDTAQTPGPEGNAAPQAAAQPSPSPAAPSPAEEYPANPEDEEDDEADLQSEIEQFDQLLDMHLPGAAEEAPRGEIIEVPVVSVSSDVVLVDFGGKAEARIPASDFPQIDGQPNVKIGDVIKAVHVGRSADGTPRLSHREARVRESEDAIRLAKEEGRSVKGLITQTVKGGLMVDIGLPAFMPASQVDLFKIPDLNSLVGQEIEALVIEFDPRRKRAVLSRRRMLFEKRESKRQEFLSGLAVDQMIMGKVKNTVDFGAFIDLGVIDGFVPREEISYDRGTPPSDILKKGMECEFKIIKIDMDQGKVTLSRKRLSTDPWEDIDGRYPIGAIVQGEVIAIQSYGAFVHLEEGVTGMIHASDMSWAPGSKKPHDFVAIGETVTSQVLELDHERRRMSLGLKQIMGDPWEKVNEKFPKGSVVKGEVTSLTNYGAFVRLDEYVEGMVHVSHLSWDTHINHPKEILKVGQEVEAKVLAVDMKARRISLGVKQMTKSPISAYLDDHPEGSVVTGKVTRFAPFGAFVELTPGVEGLIHISQIDEKRVELPEKVLTVGEEVQVKITKIEKKKGKISLSRKAAIKHAERENIKAYMKQAEKESEGTGLNLGEMIQQAQKKANKD